MMMMMTIFLSTKAGSRYDVGTVHEELKTVLAQGAASKADVFDTGSIPQGRLAAKVEAADTRVDIDELVARIQAG
eukprot:12409641-Karenia_brevis.AAC.1